MIISKFRILALGLAFMALVSACGSDKPNNDDQTSGTGLDDIWPVQSVADLGYRLPAEWEPQESVWLAWTRTGSFYDEEFMKHSARHLIKTLHQDTSIKVDLVVTPNDEEIATGKTYEEKRQEVENFLSDDVEGIGNAATEGNFIRYHNIPTTTFWMRDMGPVFLKNDAGLAMADFGFNMWDYELYTGVNSTIDDAVDRRIAQELEMPAFRCSLIAEGGNSQSDGNGTLLLNEYVARHRNPHMSLAEIEAEYKRCLGAEKILWTKRGVVEDFATYEGFAPGGFKYVYNDAFEIIGTEEVPTALGAGTSGHTDEFAIFGPNNTILLAEVRPGDLDPAINQNQYSRKRAAINKQRMDENYEILKNATNADGVKYNIIRVPVAESEFATLTKQNGGNIYSIYVGWEFEDGNMVPDGEDVDIMAATGYLNVLITNQLVIVPSYYHDGLPDYLKPITQANDQEVVEKFQALFPDRQVVQFPYGYIMPYNWTGGGIHCANWQQPVAN